MTRKQAFSGESGDYCSFFHKWYADRAQTACAGSLLAVRRLLSAHRAQPYTLAEPPATRTARVITKENTAMLIDFRVRPPYKTNLTTSLYNKPAPSSDPTKQSIFLIGKERVPSAEARSIELFMQEMDETETERAVIMGRKADDYGSVDNDEIDELARAYPGRFIPFAGVNPNLPGQVEEIERVAAMGFRGVGIDAGWLRQHRIRYIQSYNHFHPFTFHRFLLGTKLRTSQQY